MTSNASAPKLVPGVGNEAARPPGCELKLGRITLQGVSSADRHQPATFLAGQLEIR